MTSTDPTLRRHWMSVLAHAPDDAFEPLAQAALATHAFDTLRAPEIGLAMVRGRVDGAGALFNLGEATVTRCALRYAGPDGVATVGLGYHLGRNAERVRRMAALDALLQHGAHHADMMRSVVEPLRVAIAHMREREHRRSAASRVQFFTVQPEAAR
jgi:alpha-D-ribose 1-methylphosphonate 5-triphosphate synthase subunit PhnG